MKFKDLKFSIHDVPGLGIQALVFFKNGFGASVIKGQFTYGGRKGLYEIAVLEGTIEKSSISYDTDITDDVLGHLTEKDVTKYLTKIEALPINSN